MDRCSFGSVRAQMTQSQQWSCVIGAIGTLLLGIGAMLSIGVWPVVGAIGGINWYNNKRDEVYNLDKLEKIKIMSDELKALTDKLNEVGLQIGTIDMQPSSSGISLFYINTHDHEGKYVYTNTVSTEGVYLSTGRVLGDQTDKTVIKARTSTAAKKRQYEWE